MFLQDKVSMNKLDYDLKTRLQRDNSILQGNSSMQSFQSQDKAFLRDKIGMRLVQ
jgi:hypothetical protein